MARAVGWASDSLEVLTSLALEGEPFGEGVRRLLPSSALARLLPFVPIRLRLYLEADRWGCWLAISTQAS